MLGSRVPGRVMFVSSCRGGGGADNLLQLVLQADAPVGNLPQATFLRTEHLPTRVGELLFLNALHVALIEGRMCRT